MKQTILPILSILMTLLATGQSSSQHDKVMPKSSPTFYLRYSFSGLGSNMGSMQPVVEIKNNSLVYTYQQNSYFERPNQQPELICTQTFRQSSIDSTWALIKDLGNTSIRRSNFCIMSGGIHFMTISNGIDTVRFEMHNTFDPIALQIVSIVNQYLPTDKKIWADEDLIKKERECNEWLKKNRSSNRKSKTKVRSK